MPAELLIRLAWRNIWRHRRRNAILVSAIGIAVAGVVLLNTLLRGMQFDMQNAVVDNLTGHVKVLAPGYLDDPGIERGFAPGSAWHDDLEPDLVAGWAERVRVPAVVMSERETRGIRLVGIDPAREGISFLASVEIEGEGLADTGDRRLLVGHALADRLRTAVGRRLVLIALGADGRPREAGYRIAGVYRAESAALEESFAFTGADGLRRLLDADVATEISVRLTDGRHEGRVIEVLESAFPGLDVLTWRELEPRAATMAAFADTALLIYFLIVMGALAFGLVNTLTTAVMERVRELGMLRALGMRPRSVVAQVVVESSLVMALGVAIGLAAALAVFSLMADGIDLSAFDESLASFGLRPTFTPVMTPVDVMLVTVLSLVLGLLASFYPARWAVKLEPLDALRR